MSTPFDGAKKRIENKEALIGIIGLGYVGLPLAREILKADFRVLGFDIDRVKVRKINSGESYIRHIPSDFIRQNITGGRLEATDEFSRLSEPDVILVCVPTPVDEHNAPKLTYVLRSSRSIARTLREGQLIVLESTTYPGTTEEKMLRILRTSGLRVGEEFFVGYSPEREDPGNPRYTTSSIPKVVSGVTPACLELAKAFYSKVVVEIVPVSSTRVAEATKLLENIYRAVNIALVNELKIVFERMGIDIWEVIEAAKTKPFGFTAFYPGPGFGGHCIPVDPFYLTWKAHEYDSHARFIELAGETNTLMPYYVVSRLSYALGCFGKPLRGSKILLIGVSYKRDVADVRESASLKLITLLRRSGAIVDYHDPYVPVIPPTRLGKFNMMSVQLTPETVSDYDAVLIATDHSNVNYELLREQARLIVDTRNAMGIRGLTLENIFKA